MRDFPCPHTWNPSPLFGHLIQNFLSYFRFMYQECSYYKIINSMCLVMLLNDCIIIILWQSRYAGQNSFEITPPNWALWLFDTLLQYRHGPLEAYVWLRDAGLQEVCDIYELIGKGLIRVSLCTDECECSDLIKYSFNLQKWYKNNRLPLWPRCSELNFIQRKKLLLPIVLIFVSSALLISAHDNSLVVCRQWNPKMNFKGIFAVSVNLEKVMHLNKVS